MKKNIKDPKKELEELFSRINSLEIRNSELLDLTEKLKIKCDEYEKQIVLFNAKNESLKGKRFRVATVMFAEIHGLNKIFNRSDAGKVADEIDEFSIMFDKIIRKYNLVKANSIGDTFLCVGGIPDKNHTNPIEAILAAIDILRHLEELQASNIDKRNWKICF